MAEQLGDLRHQAALAHLRRQLAQAEGDSKMYSIRTDQAVRTVRSLAGEEPPASSGDPFLAKLLEYTLADGGGPTLYGSLWCLEGHPGESARCGDSCEEATSVSPCTEPCRARTRTARCW